MNEKRTDDAPPGDWQIARIEEGIADADAGRFASDEDVARLRVRYARPVRADRSG